MTYADLNIGVPNLIIILEMIPLSIFFFFAYPWSPYLLSHQRYADDGEMGGRASLPSRYEGGPLGIHAWLGMLDPTEIVQAIIFAFKIITGARKNVGIAGMTTKSTQSSLGADQTYDLLAPGQEARPYTSYDAYRQQTPSPYGSPGP
jgi:hypothetical protein